jgi:hypothetical protein
MAVLIRVPSKKFNDDSAALNDLHIWAFGDIPAFVASRTDAVASIPARLAEYLVDDLQLAVFRTPLNLIPEMVRSSSVVRPAGAPNDGMLAQLCGPGALGCGQGFRAARTGGLG